jgi:HNH endonuclease/NUMOD4 motif/AP2 domain
MLPRCSMIPIPGYESHYSISELGEIVSKRGHVMKPRISGNGYLEIYLQKYNVRRLWRIHRLLALTFLSMREEQVVDHIDRNPLNNALSNLRCCDRSQNLWNSKKRKDNQSGYKGVYFCTRTNKWGAMIAVRHKRIWLGRFTSKEEASSAYKIAQNIHHGEFAA